jgi:dsRNA-specific ribonuclease
MAAIDKTHIKDAEKAEKTIGYHFEDHALLWEALHAPGSGIAGAQMSGSRVLTEEGNKRMAGVGDAWLKLVTTMEWFNEELPRSMEPLPLI